ncbi:MAG: hypothetical protein PHD91_08395 [bacterium]|nr:hypothetical protein [bacterium]
MYKERFDKGKRILAAEFEANLLRMNYSGLYALRAINSKEIDDSIQSDDKLSALLENRGHDILYVGKATTTLISRLGQELRALAPGTFFRSAGAIIGKMPVPGCLIGARNTNYFFPGDIKEEIIDWINHNIYVSFFKLEEDIETEEKNAIGEIKPALNIQHNRHFVYSYLMKRRQECINYARSLAL